MTELPFVPTTDQVREAVAEWCWSRRMFRPELEKSDGAEIDRWLTAHDAEVRADERAKFDAEIAMLRGAGKTLGTQIERAGRAIQGAVNRPDLLNGDGEGDWELVFELLAGLRPRAESAEQALAAERAKRPDREQIARTLFLGDNPDCPPDRIHESTLWATLRDDYLISADAVLALDPEAREEPKHGLIEDYTAVQAPDWTKVSGKLDAREEARRKVRR